MAKPDRYHHGDLREALLAAALVAIARDGVSSVSLRQLAREVGVSHAAPAHHFQDRTGLFTAIAARGFELLDRRLREAVDQAANNPKSRLAASGKAYVMFAADNPAYFEVMFRPDLVHNDDAALRDASRRSFAVLQSAIAASRGATAGVDLELEALKAWTHAHGLATLWNSGALPAAMAPDGLSALADRLFGCSD